MSKNFERTGKPFERMKILLICTIGWIATFRLLYWITVEKQRVQFSPFERMNRTSVNPFKRMPQLSERTLLVDERMQKLFERMSQYFERMLMYFERICKPFERFVERFEQIFIGVRTDDERITVSVHFAFHGHKYNI